MGVLTELAHDGPEDYERLKGRPELHDRGALDFLDTLVSLGFLNHEGTVYSNTNTPETDLFLDQHEPSYIGGML